MTYPMQDFFGIFSRKTVIVNHEDENCNLSIDTLNSVMFMF